MPLDGKGAKLKDPVRSVDYSLWMRFLIKFGTFGPVRGGFSEDDLSLLFFLRANVTLMMKLAIRFSRTTITASCERTPARFSPRTLGFVRIQKSSLAEALVLSEADLRALSLW